MAYRHHHRAGGGQLQALLDYEYSPGNLIGHGAFALVFKGRKKKTLEVVAIKQISLKSAPDHLSSIRQKEIEILKEVKHTNVVQLLDYHEEKSHIYLVMEYCNGGDLGDYLQTKHTLCEDSIRHLTNHIANALATLHSQHIIHRDIKPQNLLLSYPSPSPSSSSSSSSSLSGSEGAKCDRTITEATIKLADFGFARHLNGTDMAATLCGSPLYMAPEVLLGERYDGKADLWSIGTIIFQCLTGSAPFLANNPHALRRRYEREKLVAKIPEGTSRHLASLLAKLLRKNPRDRLGHGECESLGSRAVSLHIYTFQRWSQEVSDCEPDFELSSNVLSFLYSSLLSLSSLSNFLSLLLPLSCRGPVGAPIPSKPFHPSVRVPDDGSIAPSCQVLPCPHQETHTLSLPRPLLLSPLQLSTSESVRDVCLSFVRSSSLHPPCRQRLVSCSSSQSTL
jgi:serine/threonine protein kinase